MAGLAGGGEVAVSEDGTGVAAALVARLAARGYAARTIVDPSELSEATRVVIALDGLRAWQPSEGDALCSRVFRLARAFAPRAERGDCIFVSVYDCGGDFGLRGHEQALIGSLAGLVKTAAQEWPEASVKAIDLERGGRNAETLAEAIEQELLSGGPEIEIGLRADGRRVTLCSQLAPLPSEAGANGDIALHEGAVVVCSGGARGVTAATMIALAGARHLRFALLGRTPLAPEPEACRGVSGDAALKRVLLQAARARGETMRPAELGRQVRRVLAQREIRAALQAIQERGGEAAYVAVDVTDEEQLSIALAEVRSRWGAIDAVVHGAGVVADKRIADKTDEQFERVWSTKVNGLRALLRATYEDELRALILFSSVAARSGNVGQCDYAMANEALNKIAGREARRRGVGCIVKSLNWGPWEAGMVTPSLRAYFEANDVPLIPLVRGGQMLLQELSTASHTAQVESGPVESGPVELGPVEIVLGGPPRHASIAGASATQKLDILIDQQRCPYLAGHAIDGVVVLPLVMVAEWLSRAAEAFVPGMYVVACEDLRVLRGVRMDRFATAGHWLQLRAQPTDAAIVGDDTLRLDMTLSDPHDHRIRHYTAQLLLSRQSAPPPQAQLSQPDDLQPWKEVVYGQGSALFHTAAFQVLQPAIQVAPDGAEAQLLGLCDMGWPAEPWCHDPALLDGGLQLAVLWAQHRLGAHALPTGVARISRYRRGAEAGAVHCRLSARTEDELSAESHIELFDREGRLIAAMEGVQTHRRP